MAGNWPEIIPLPPSGVTGELGSWLRDLANVVNTKLARASYFSGTTPTSAVTALPGYFAINMSPSQSTDSRIFVHGGTGTTPNQSNWVVLRIA